MKNCSSFTDIFPVLNSLKNNASFSEQFRLLIKQQHFQMKQRIEFDLPYLHTISNLAIIFLMRFCICLYMQIKGSFWAYLRMPCSCRLLNYFEPDLEWWLVVLILFQNNSPWLLINTVVYIVLGLWAWVPPSFLYFLLLFLQTALQTHKISQIVFRKWLIVTGVKVLLLRIFVYLYLCNY